MATYNPYSERNMAISAAIQIAHEAECERNEAEMYNLGAAGGDDFVSSKTSKGWVTTTTRISKGRGRRPVYEHDWQPYDANWP